MQDVEKGAESFHTFFKYAALLSFLWHNKFFELPPFGLLHRWFDIRMIHQISSAFSPLALEGRRTVLNVPILCLMTTWELSRKSPIKINTGELGRDWCS